MSSQKLFDEALNSRTRDSRLKKGKEMEPNIDARKRHRIAVLRFPTKGAQLGDNINGF